MKGYLAVLLLLISFSLSGATPRRDANTVKKERKEAARKIEKTKKQIEGNLEDTKREFDRLSTIQADIKIQEKDLSILQTQKDSLSLKIGKLNDSVQSGTKKVEALKESYSQLLRAVRHQRQSASPYSFIFSSSSFRQAFRRVRYLRDLASREKSAAESLSTSITALEMQKGRLDSVNTVLTASIDTIETRRQALEQKGREAKALVSSLKRQSRNLTKVLEREQSRATRLEQELNRIIEEEARAAAAAERKKKEAEKKQTATNKTATGPVKTKTSQRPVAIEPGTPFAQCKGHLPYPVDKQSKIVSGFGRRTHSELSRVEIQNNGIDLETSQGAHALAVHEGTVSMVIVMEGFGNVVLVRHGEYLTVYAGLEDLKVKKGDTVKGGQILGTIHSDANDHNRTRLHFEVRKEKEKLNPAEWLR